MQIPKKLIEEIERKIGGKFSSGENERAIYDIATYFQGRGDLDLTKGLHLYGNVGTGKTVLMESIRRCIVNETNRTRRTNPMYYSMVETDMIREEYDDASRHGDPQDALDYYTKDSKYDMGSAKNWLFDDLGQEDMGIYGKNIMVNIIRYRNKAFLDMGMISHFTSNFQNEEGVINVYDQRTLDRLTEMCNFVYFKGNSFRK